MNASSDIDKIRDCLAGKPGLRLAIVFGSLATGQPRFDSDLDIAVAGDSVMTGEQKMALIRELADQTGRSVDLVDINAIGEPMLGQILASGKRVLGSDQVHAELLSRHLFDQADFMPYRDRLLAERRKAWLQQ
ncbi:nucleotidyltransferase domain-containing protein [Wenzhouxiangella sp. AB-CW3]|uniref:type VII toxin-antitoxin system MntA family adenylyltransferase antitoxin n=1 Tax=Wenzhouxiangella sp. AB-CW3 TaxID=2771012 RepID=UPI00168B404F|nr:nucleotidyltransferase domain-containing protein [Wenzhouxiangella sp. AB-CW3]QOC22406.1 nucleotidyltransferase domain-containing protein [Wenzhouxiangella sp. AB-CW3]